MRARPWSVALAAVGALATAAHAETPMKVRIGTATGSLVAASARVADEMGLFKEHGLEASFTMLDSANAATTALIAGSIDATVSGPGELIIAQGRGQRVVAIADTYAGVGGSLVLAKSVADKLGVSAAAPIAQRLKALDGLLIASTTATSSYTVAYKSSAQAQGAAVRLTFMSLPAMPAALEAGAIQGYIAGSPYWIPPVLKGTAVMWVSGPKRELPADHAPTHSADLQMMRATAEAKPELVEKLVGVYRAFGKAIDERPDDVKKAIAKVYPDLDAKTIDLLYEADARAWNAPPLTAEEVTHDIAFVKASINLPQLDQLDSKSLIFP
jgi:sulfonate transport system substrate-binding protein